MEPSWTTTLLRQICAEKDYRIECCDLQPSMCRVVFPDGGSTLFFSSTLNINGAASRIGAVDKAYTKFFLEKERVSVPDGGVVFSEAWNLQNNLNKTKNALLEEYRDRNNFPLIVKPNRGFQGRSVYKVYNHRELDRALDLVLESTNAAVVEECVTGEEYRLVLYKGKLIAAYLKTPLRVIGDGESSIGELLENKRMEQIMRGRGDVIVPHVDYITDRLHQSGYTLQDVLPVGVELRLRDNANLSTGGDVVDVTEKIHTDYLELAKKIANIMDLDLIGIDVISKTPINEPLSQYWVLEVAYTPGLHHYASLGEEQYQKVKSMYSDIIESLRKRRNV